MCSNMDATLSCLDLWSECLTAEETETKKVETLEDTMRQYMGLPPPFRQNDLSTCAAYVSRGLFQ